MISLKDTLISEDIIEEHFVCDLTKCKGVCCVEGDSGAPLEKSECALLEEVLPFVSKFLNEENKKAISLQGAWIIDKYDKEPTTPLVNNKDCAYLFYDENHNALCAIEAAYKQGTIKFKKPISCHLYPIRVTKLMSFTALNYHKWEICSDACILGKKLKLPLYEFLKEPLVRKFGKSWYNSLKLIAENYKAQK